MTFAAARVLAVTVALVAFAVPVTAQQRAGQPQRERLRPGISVLLDDQLSLIRGRRIALVVDPGARDEHGKSVEAIVVDVLDRGTRAGSAAWVVRAALHAAVRRGVPVIVLDRPNPLTGEHAEGPVTDSMAGSSDALYGLPSRHGMTIGEVARWLNGQGTVGAALTVVPVRGWRRSEWLAGRGAKRIADSLGDRMMPGVRYTASRDRFTATSGGATALPSLRVEITDRDRASGWRAVAAVFSAIRAAHADSLAVDGAIFDRIVGDPGFRAALAAGDDPDTVIDRALGRIVDFRRRAGPLLLYR